MGNLKRVIGVGGVALAGTILTGVGCELLGASPWVAIGALPIWCILGGLAPVAGPPAGLGAILGLAAAWCAEKDSVALQIAAGFAGVGIIVGCTLARLVRRADVGHTPPLALSHHVRDGTQGAQQAPTERDDRDVGPSQQRKSLLGMLAVASLASVALLSLFLDSPWMLFLAVVVPASLYAGLVAGHRFEERRGCRRSASRSSPQSERSFGTQASGESRRDHRYW